MKPSILISSHFAYFNVRTGMTLFVKDLAEYLSTDYDVTVHTVRDIVHDRLVVNNVTYITGASWHNKSDYDITIGHSPHNGGCDVQLFDTVKHDEYGPQITRPKLAVFSTRAVQKHYDYPGIVLHPIVYPERNKARRGRKITLIGMTNVKGMDLLLELARANPKLEFLGVRAGWRCDTQEHPELPNLEIMQQTDDVRKIWRKTKVLLVPSYEQYGKVGVEASACGIPTIAMDCAGARESLGASGTLIAGKYILDWQIALTRVLDNYKEYSHKAVQHSKTIDSITELELLKKEIERL